MRTIEAPRITETIARLCMEANYNLGADMLAAFERASRTERSPAGRDVLALLKENAHLARTQRVPYCQDTGFVICFADIGQDVHIVGGDFETAINEGVRRGYIEGYLRASIVGDPFQRKNTGDNTPAVIHTRIVPGDRLTLMVMAKGGGCENRSKYKMCTPAEGIAGVKQFIIECIRTAGPDACPPLIAGVGVGGTFEKAALLSKRSLFRGIGDPNPDPALQALEQELLEAANALGIGPQGYGGDTTALAIHINTYPCHIASLPVAVTIECHAHRHQEAVL
ncbi:MAG: fumarate hydratase [Deltaproteobacteria bacterium]|nr:fumarate hydratase [Deltaproteobacteria bacterium]